MPRFGFAPLLALLLFGSAIPADDSADTLRLKARSRVAANAAVPVSPTTNGTTAIATVPRLADVMLDPRKTAVIVCDMWDDHWCKSACHWALQNQPLMGASNPARVNGAPYHSASTF